MAYPAYIDPVTGELTPGFPPEGGDTDGDGEFDEPFEPESDSLADKIRAAVMGIAAQIDLTTNISEEVLGKPAPPGSGHSTMKDYFVDQLIELDWRIIPTSATIGDGQGVIDEPATSLLQWLGDMIYDAGEMIEDLIEGIVSVLFDVLAWLLDVVWTDIIVNQLIKWLVYIVTAGLRVLIGAPSYFLGHHVVESFLSRLAGADLQQWIADFVPHMAAAMDPEENESWFDQVSITGGFNLPIEGLVERFMAAFGEGIDLGNLANVPSEVPDGSN